VDYLAGHDGVGTTGKVCASQAAFGSDRGPENPKNWGIESESCDILFANLRNLYFNQGIYKGR